MTEEQRTELNYLLDIVLEASKWTRTPDDDRDQIRMEVEHRINLLTGREDSRDEDLEQEPEPEQDKSKKPYWTDAKRNYTKTRVRVKVDGKNVWKPKDECRKEVMPGWQTKMHWVWYGPQNKETEDEQ